MPATMGMKGAGYYDQNSAAQMSAIRGLTEWVDEAIGNLPLPAEGQPVTVFDLGSSEGRNAISMMANIVARLRRRTDAPIRTIYSDLASNDFNRLFANLEDAEQAGLFSAEVYAGAVAGSFYGPLVPPGTVHLATSFNAIQWLDRLPAVPMPDSVVYRRPHPSRPGRDVSPAATAAFTRQAAEDLTRFLEFRARELVPGAKLLVAGPGDSEETRMSDGLAALFNDACADLLEDRQLKRQAYERLKIPVYFRTVTELLEPLKQDDSPVRGAFAVERAGAMEVPTPFLVALRRDGDAAAYAEAFTGFLRAFSEPVVRAALDEPEGKVGTVESLYERIRARLCAEPDRYPWRYILVAALLTRR
jgi:hypothetical protein